MRTARPDLTLLSRLILVIFLIAHAPIAGAMTAAQAGGASGDVGPAGLVICTDDGFKQVAAPEGSGPLERGDVSDHDCLCPCATLCAAPALPAPASAAALLGDVGEARQIIWPVRVGLAGAWPPHAGPAHPRAPPASIL